MGSLANASRLCQLGCSLQQLRQSTARLRASGNSLWPASLGLYAHFRHQLSGHHTLGCVTQLCDRGALSQAWPDSWWSYECDFWQRSGIDCKFAAIVHAFIRAGSPVYRRSYIHWNLRLTNAQREQVSIIALKNGEIRIVQSSMLGSILSNILLV